jgi:hypothetical protein
LQRTHQTNPNCPYETIWTTIARTFGSDQTFLGYLSNNSDVPNSEGYWTNIIHGALEELMPDDDPESLGSLVTSTQYWDSNLKHHGQVLSETNETTAYGSVFVTAWNCFKLIIDLPNMPRYLVDPIHDKSSR